MPDSHDSYSAHLSELRDEPLKFSVRRDMQTEGGNFRRTVIFLIIIVSLGVGLLLLVQSFIGNQAQQDNTTASSSTSSVQQIDGINIDNFESDDSLAFKSVTNSQYTSADLALGSSSNADKNVVLESLDHKIFSGFTETRFNLSSGAKGLPQTQITYNPDTLIVSVTFQSLNPKAQDMLSKFAVSMGEVESIALKQKNKDLTVSLQLSEDGKFFAVVDGKNSLVLYTKSNTELTKPISSASSTSSTSSVSSTSSAASSTSSASSGVNYENDPSQSKQSIVSNVTGNKLVSETYYYQKSPGTFSFSWAIRGLGESFIPNATAEYITDSGKTYIEVKISNLSYEIMHAKGRDKAVISISTAGSNLANVWTKGLSAGTATFWVETQHGKTDFQLFDTLTEGSYQLLTLKLWDK